MTTIRTTPRAPFRKRRTLGFTAATLALAIAAPLTAGAATASAPASGARVIDTTTTASVAATLRRGAVKAEAGVPAGSAKPATAKGATVDLFAFAAAVQHAQWVRLLAFAAAVQHAAEQAAASAAPAAPVGIWDQLAQCESGGNWSINTGSFDGGLQFLPSTWTAQGGGRYAPYAYQATRDQQIAIAERLLAATGGSYRASWPGCSRHLGLR